MPDAIGRSYFLGPTARRLDNGKLDGNQLRGQGRIHPSQVREWLGAGGQISIKMAPKFDFSPFIDLIESKTAIADKGVFSKGNPVTCIFALMDNKTVKPWRFTLEANNDREANTFVNIPFGYETTTNGPLPFGTFEDKTAINWVLQYYGLKGVKMTAHFIPILLRGGAMGISNAMVGAAHTFGSIVSGADHSLGSLFTLAASHENVVLGRHTGGPGFAAGIMGGAFGFEWNDSYHPNSAIAYPLFGPERYEEFQKHVVMYLPGTPAHTKRSDSTINKKWIHDMTLTAQGNSAFRRFTEWSQMVVSGLINSDWIQVCTGLQNQTDVKQSSCPLFLSGIEQDAEKIIKRNSNGDVIRAIIRPGAGGPGTPGIIISSTPELADEAMEIVGPVIESTPETVKIALETGKVPRGRIPYKLTKEGIIIEFIGISNDHKFKVPLRPEEVSFSEFSSMNDIYDWVI